MSPSRGNNFQRHINHDSSRRRRRASPIYDDYPGYTEPTREGEHSVSFSRTKHSRSLERPGTEPHSRHDIYQRVSEGSDSSRRPSSPRRPRDDERSGPSRSSPKPFLFAGANIYPSSSQCSRSASPLPAQQSRRTSPSEEYLATSLEPASILKDASLSRKLVVLDLNGSLVLRSPHRKQPGRPDPYSDHTRLRPLRAVHRRPYLTAFTSYLLHTDTKKWLDTMIWSSAQPHSVQDMSEKCFEERKSELKAIWARDTLGLAEGDYHRKAQTVKDLEKPWSQLKSAKDESSEFVHSARTTILVDDSPLKAALQPWNHLCIKEYLSETRKWDLGVADWEAAKERVRQAREAHDLEKERRLQKVEEAEREKRLEEEKVQASLDDPAVTKMIREVVMVNGKMIGEEQVVKNVTREVAMVDGVMAGEEEGFAESIPAPGEGEKQSSTTNKKRKLKRLAKKEAVLRAKEELEKEVLLAQFHDSIEDGEIGIDELVDEETQLAALKDKMKYDETLLAVVGILDHIKHENNVAAWFRSGGLLRTPPDVTYETTSVSSRSESPPPSPTKKRRLEASSPPTSPPPSSQTIGPVEALDKPSLDAQAATGVPLVNSSTSSNEKTMSNLPHTLWFDRPAVLTYWADRGRQACKLLGIEVRHGVVP